MAFALAWAAIRRHPFSSIVTVLLVTLSASLLDLAAPVVLGLWLVGAVLALLVWRAFEPRVLRLRGCHAPGRLDRERLDQVSACAGLDIMIVDRAEPWLGRGLRCLVISRGMFDLLEDRALVGLLTRAALDIPSADLAGEIVVWLGNLPVLGAWWLGRGLGLLGHLLAIVVGTSLVLPLVFWRVGFPRIVGGVFGSMIVGLLGSSLLSVGFAAPGLGLLLAWAIVPALQALLHRETGHAETVTDLAIVDAGLGWQLLEALETLVWAESMPAPDRLLGVLSRFPTPAVDRADRVWRAISQE